MKLADQLDKLHAYKVIVESGTMREAAKRLGVTQPSLTKLIQNFEQAAGLTFLSRGRHGVLATEAGKHLFDFASVTLKNLEDLEQKLLHPNESTAGHLRVGAYASLAEYLWPDFIRSFRKRAPALRLSINTSEAVSHQRALERGEIDVLVEAEPRLSEGLVSWKLYEDRFHFYLAQKLVMPGIQDAVEALPLIYSPHAFDHENMTILQHLEEKGYSFREKIELDSFTAVLAFARREVGLAVLPKRLAEAAVKAGELRPVSLRGFPGKGFGLHHFAATVEEHRKDDPRIRLLIRELREWFRSK